MAKVSLTSLNDYLARQPKAARRVLTRVREAIRKAVPKADEVMSYGIPTYKLNGRAVVYFAGWKEHFSIYPANVRLVAEFKDELAPFDVNDKGTIRFPLTEPVPVKLIAGIAKFRAREVAAGTSGKRPRIRKKQTP